MKKFYLLSACTLALLAAGAQKVSAQGATPRTTVSTFQELKAALADDNDITQVTLASDIQITEGVHINPNKTSVTIDGQGHTLTENASSVGSSTANIYVSENNGVKSVTLKNTTVVGKNYYGPITIGSGALDVTYNVENVNYMGPQFIYNPQGYCNFTGTNHFMIQSDTGTATMEEFAETSGVTIADDFTLTSNTTGGYSAFWFDHSEERVPLFNVKEGAHVEINGIRNIFYSGSPLDINIGDDAQVALSTERSVFDLGTAGNVTVGEDATFDISRTGANVLGNATLHVSGQLKTLPGATFKVVNAPETVADALSTDDDAYIDIDQPSLVDIVAPASKKALKLNDTTLNVTANELNDWVNNDSDTPTVSITTPLSALLAIDGDNQQLLYSDQASAFDYLRLATANRVQFKG